MGEAADLVLDGILCEACGEMVDGDETGHPRKCDACARPQSASQQRSSPPPSQGRGSRFAAITLDEFHAALKKEKGWYLCEDNAKEFIFGWRPKSQPNLEIKVATTINKGNEKHRRYGKDAIRVWAIWCPEDKRNCYGLVKSKHVKRTKGWQQRLEKTVMDVLQMAQTNLSVVGH